MAVDSATGLARVFVGSALLFLVPGLLILAPLRRRLALTHLDTVCAATGLSLAVVPLTLYFTTLVCLPQSAPFVNTLLLTGTSALLFLGLLQWRQRNTQRQQIEPRDSGRIHPFRTDITNLPPWLTGAVVGFLFAATLVGRLWSVQGIDYPLWTDSFGHTLIAALIERQGTIPSGYEPYAPIGDFSYHFGFHTIAVWTHWITGLALPHSVLVSGQIINALVVPTTYLFAARLIRNPLAGLIAALVAGLLSHMPSQFVNWGRYTQLCGQILLPVVLVFWLELLRATSNKRFLYACLSVLAFSGLFMVHYRILIFAVLMAALALGYALVEARHANHQAHAKRAPHGPWRSRITLLATTFGTGLATLVLVSPWLARLLAGFGAQFAQEVAGGYDTQAHGDYFDFSLRYLVDFGAHLSLLSLAAIAALWGLLRRERPVWILVLWLISLFATANLHLAGITPFYSTTIVVLFLYLPVSLLIGYLSCRVVEFFVTAGSKNSAVRSHWRQLSLALGGLAIVLAGSWYGISRDLELVAPENGLVQPADERAIAWIKQNIPEDALFYIATSFWTPRVAHGLDGGYWLPLLAERQTIMPLQKYASDGQPAYTEFVNQRLRDIESVQQPEDLWQRLRDYHITHIYIGARPTALDPNLFVDYPKLFTLLYAQDNVWIFAVDHS